MVEDLAAARSDQNSRISVSSCNAGTTERTQDQRSAVIPFPVSRYLSEDDTISTARTEYEKLA
jgi:hypothetical protein